MAASSCHSLLLLQLSLPKNPPPSFRPITPSQAAAAAVPSRLRNLVTPSWVETRPLSPAPFFYSTTAINPAGRNATVLFSSSGYNVQVMVGDDEPEEVLLRRFRREVTKAGVIQECKRRRFFENKQEERKRKAREAGRRNRRRRSGPRTGFSSAASESPSKKAVEDVEDNWEMPEGALPY